MFRRTRGLLDPVTVHLDGSPVPAERGEPLAVALVAADNLTLARSPKLHRPRGPACFRGGCDGCLARVNGVPNVMTCLRAAEGGERIETQNVVGSRRADLLRVTDWFFPQGIDHHHLLAGVPGISDVMQSFARKLAGLGRLPESAEPAREAERIEMDAVVIGGGPAGLAVASRLDASGKRIALVDDGVRLGGSLQALRPSLRPSEKGHAFAHAAESVARGSVRVFGASTAAGIYAGELLVAGPSGAVVIRARAWIFATGAHDPALDAPNNDLPGVFSARALCFLASHGVHPKHATAVIGRERWADELAGWLGEEAIVRIDPEDVESLQGTGEVRAVTIKRGADRRKIDVDAVAIATPPAPAFEIAEQAGARAEYVQGRGYAVQTDANGRAGDGLWAIGECTGASFDPDAFERAAEAIAADVLASLP
jgi:sarcosine oxidase subunit alpha